MARVVLGALTLSLVLAGCGGDPEAPPDPTATTSGVSTTPSTPPTPSAPVLPEAATANTKAGAIAFVRHYVEVFNHAQATGVHAELEKLSSRDCDECEAVVAGLAKIYGAKGHIEGGALVAGAATAEYNAAERRWLVLVRVDSGPQTVFASSAADPQELHGGARSMQFSVRRESGNWKIAAWSRT